MVEIGEGLPATRLILRGDAAVAARAGAAFGVSLSAVPHCANVQDGGAAGGRAALWLGPDEWLLLAPEGDVPDLAGALDDALAGITHSLVEVSDGFVALWLRGEDAALTLSAGCPLDLDLAAFPPGMATRTVLGRIGITLWRRAAEDWHIEVARSHAAYARAFLTEAMPVSE